MKKIKVGKINNVQLLELFGTKKQKDNYRNNKKMNTGEKKRILTKANKFCNIEDLGKGDYMIHEAYNMKEKTFNDAVAPLKKGLNKYLTPLILSKIISDQDENYKITLPFLGWAGKFEVVNMNYPLLKYNQEEGSKYLDIDEGTMFDYFERMDECIRYYLEKILSILGDRRRVDLIEFDRVTKVKKQNKIIKENKEKNVTQILCDDIDEIISDEDRKYVIDCENKAKKKAGITRPQEKFYGTKSKVYKSELNKLLSQKGILYTYSAYNIFCKDKKGVESLLKEFSDVDFTNEDKIVEAFHENFLEHVESKATNRQKKEIEKNVRKEFRLLQSYILDFKNLSQLTIPRNVESLYGKVRQVNKNGEDVDILDVMKKYNIEIINKGGEK